MRGKIATGLTLFIIGLWIWLSNMGILNFGRDWPFILVIIGLYFLIEALIPRRRKSKRDLEGILKELEENRITTEEALKKIKEE